MRAFLNASLIGLLAILGLAGFLLMGCATPNGGTVTLPEVGGDICYDVAFDGNKGQGRVCMHLVPGPDGVPELAGPAKIMPQ